MAPKFHRIATYLASSPNKKSKAAIKSTKEADVVPMVNGKGARGILHRAIIPTGSHKTLTVVEGGDEWSAATSMHNQRGKGPMGKDAREPLGDHSIELDHTSSMVQSSKDEIEYLAEFQPLELLGCVGHGGEIPSESQ
ncbi:hypothetical protein V6N13_046209 [Hibiscus sabdariffa]|uniref:Uncharacterized protein n=2 Tax=Hibiscus sabdariffa TaxID=183260 RepID=A0ABR1ZVS8_9ROSI